MVGAQTSGDSWRCSMCGRGRHMGFGPGAWHDAVNDFGCVTPRFIALPSPLGSRRPAPRRADFFRARTSHQHLFRVIDRIPTDDTTRTPSCLLSIARGAFNTFSERRRGIESERGTRIATRERLHHSRRERSVTLVRLLVPGPSAYDSARSASLASESAPSVASTSVGVSSSASVATSPERPALAI